MEEVKTKTKVPQEEQKSIMERQPFLAQQSLDSLDPSKITPLSPEVISRQATINVGNSPLHCRNDRTRGAREVDDSEGDIGRARRLDVTL